MQEFLSNRLPNLVNKALVLGSWYFNKLMLKAITLDATVVLSFLLHLSRQMACQIAAVRIVL